MFSLKSCIIGATAALALSTVSIAHASPPTAGISVQDSENLNSNCVNAIVECVQPGLADGMKTSATNFGIVDFWQTEVAEDIAAVDVGKLFEKGAVQEEVTESIHLAGADGGFLKRPITIDGDTFEATFVALGLDGVIQQIQGETNTGAHFVTASATNAGDLLKANHMWGDAVATLGSVGMVDGSDMGSAHAYVSS